jgi:hypothetical protein
MRSLIPIVRRQLTRNTRVIRGVRRSRSRISRRSRSLRLRGDRVRRSILAIHRLIAYSRGISGIRVSDLARRRVGREHIRVMFLSSETTGAELSVAVLGLALPEFALGGAGGVAVVGGGAEGFLFLVVADETEFDEDGEGEEDAGWY